MNLSKLLENVEYELIKGNISIEINDIMESKRRENAGKTLPLQGKIANN